MLISKYLYNAKNIYLGIVSLVLIAIAINLAFANTTNQIVPTSDGAYREWNPTSGTVHRYMIDETPCNGTTDYNWTTTVGKRDSYGVSLYSVPNGSLITAIEIAPCASRNNTGGGSSVMNVFYRYNGVDSSNLGNYSLTGITPAELTPVSFGGLSLVKSASSALQIGAVLTSGNKGARLSRIAATITYTPLSAPSNIDAVNTSSTQNDLSWADNSSIEDGFRVERSLNGQFGPFTEIASTSAGVISYSDSGLVADQTYYYRVRAYNVGGFSSYSNTDYAITATVFPSDPTDLAGTASSTSTHLNWMDTSSNEEGFSIERSVDGTNFSVVASTMPNAVSHEDTNLSSGTYYYRINAFNTVGYSGYSNTVSVTVP